MPNLRFPLRGDLRDLCVSAVKIVRVPALLLALVHLTGAVPAVAQDLAAGDRDHPGLRSH